MATLEDAARRAYETAMRNGVANDLRKWDGDGLWHSQPDGWSSLQIALPEREKAKWRAIAKAVLDA